MSPGALLILVLTLGGAGLYVAMPGGRLHAARGAFVLLAGAAAALLALLLPLAGDHAHKIWFALVALAALLGAVRMITHTKPVYSALYFIVVAVSVGALLLMMGATFLAAALIIIYAGAILVTYVFVIMLAQQSGGPAPYDKRAREPLFGVLIGFVLLAVLSVGIPENDLMQSVSTLASDAAGSGQTEYVGTHLLTQYIVGVEIAGVLLLAAMVGAVAIARRRPLPAEEGEVS